MSTTRVLTIGRYSTGMELHEGSEANARVGRFSDGVAGATPDRTGRFSDGQAFDLDGSHDGRIGSFADGAVG